MCGDDKFINTSANTQNPSQEQEEAMTSILSTSNAEQYYSQGLRGRFQVDALRIPTIASPSQKFADIDYEFTEEDYRKRTEAVLRAGGLETHLPAGFPRAVDGPMTWSGADFPNEDAYVVHLTDEWKAEIKSALDHFLCKSISFLIEPLPIIRDGGVWFVSCGQTWPLTPFCNISSRPSEHRGRPR